MTQPRFQCGSVTIDWMHNRLTWNIKPAALGLKLQWIIWFKRQTGTLIGLYIAMFSSLRESTCHHASLSGQTFIQHMSSSSGEWMEVGSGSQFLASGWPHYPATGIQSIRTLLGTSTLLLDQPRPLCILSKEVGLAATDICPCGKRQTMSHIVNSCPQTKLEGGLQQLHSALNGWRHMARNAQDNISNDNNTLTGTVNVPMDFKFWNNEKVCWYKLCSTGSMTPFTLL